MRFSCIYILCFLCYTFNAIAQDTLAFTTVPAGKYQVGRANYPANPKRTIALHSYEISTTEITNAQFAEFVAATGYVTLAEKHHNAMVFEPGLAEFRWIQDTTAYWRYPNGITRGGIEHKQQHPVTTISYKDAQAYCQWAGYRLPTVDEWEVAANAGKNTTYFWGNQDKKIGEYANIWHGRDHLVADSSDGFMYTSPVKSFKPNPWGLYDVYGNVFELCEGKAPYDRPESKSVHARGGSWWCSKHSCSFFNSIDIGASSPFASFSNVGFRVVKK